jgi:hypothetical protein
MAKQQIVTFKVDESLLEELQGIPNRSEFIRAAILSALDSGCPLCRGTGVLTPRQKEHWEAFGANHSVEECDECHELRLVCANENS